MRGDQDRRGLVDVHGACVMLSLGSASIDVQLKDGIITVFHGTDGVVLHEVQAEPGMWEAMFDAMIDVLYGRNS